MEQNLKTDVLKAEAINSLGKGIPSIVWAGNAKVFRYDNPETVKKHIKKLVRNGGSAKVIRGIKMLKIAAGETNETQPQLRKGQIIFGTVSAAHAMGAKNPIWTFFLNLLGTLLVTGEARKYAYLHVAVYAGKFNGQHYVIENGGGDPDFYPLGMISAVPMDQAFEDDASFFIISPPKDSDGKSTRHLVLQRALACLGTFFRYDMQSVSCEVFAMTLMKLEPKLEPIQLDALKPVKPCLGGKKDADQAEFMKFHQDLLQKLEWYQDDTILTLDYYLKNMVDQAQKAKATKKCQDADLLNKACGSPWWVKMDQDYESFADAVKQQNLENVQALINKGLNIHGNLRGESMNAIDYADAKGFTELTKLLERNGALRDNKQKLVSQARKQD